MCPHISGTERVGFLNQDAHGNLVVDSLPVIFPFPPFTKGFWCKRPLGERESYLFYSQKNPQTDTFLHDISPTKLHSTAWVRNPKGISKLMNKVDCPVPRALLRAIVWAFLATKSFAAGSSTYPCHMACISKSVPLSNCCPQWHRNAVDVKRDSRGQSLSVPFLFLQGSQVRKEVLSWYCFCMWLPRRKGM
jgi:hypothetical protein